MRVRPHKVARPRLTRLAVARVTISFDGPFLGEGPFEFAFYQEKEEEIWGEVAQVPLTVRLDNLQRSPRRTPYPVPIALFLDPKGLVPQRSADLWPVRWGPTRAGHQRNRITVVLHGMRVREC